MITTEKISTRRIKPRLECLNMLLNAPVTIDPHSRTILGFEYTRLDIRHKKVYGEFYKPEVSY